MDNLYFILIVLTPIFPIALSFDKRVRYVRSWIPALLAAIIIAVPFILWDEYFTKNNVWGFNIDYLVGFSLGHLPIEEISFFIVVPFACIFIYECVQFYFKNLDLAKFNLVFIIVMLGYAIFVWLKNPDGWYTFSAVVLTVLVSAIVFLRRQQLSRIPLSFIISMIPFMIINGVLTGYGIDQEIVWYDEAHFSGMRIITIPFEDVLYSFSLISLNIIVFEWLKSRFAR